MLDRFKTCSQCPRKMKILDENEDCFRHCACNEGSLCDAENVLSIIRLYLEEKNCASFEKF